MSLLQEEVGTELPKEDYETHLDLLNQYIALNLELCTTILDRFEKQTSSGLDVTSNINFISKDIHTVEWELRHLFQHLL